MGKKVKERKAKAKAARRHPKNETPEVIELSDQAANDATINTQDANDGVVLEQVPGDIPEQISYDTTGRGDDLLEDEQPKKRETNETLAQAMANQIAQEADGEEADIAFAELSLKFRDWFTGLPSAVGKSISGAWKGFQESKLHKTVVDGWVKWDTFADRKVTELYTWAHNKRLKFEETFPPPVNRRDMHNFTQVLAEVFAETEKKHVLAINELKAQIKRLENVIEKQHPVTVSPEKLNELLDMVRAKRLTQAAQSYRTMTGVPLQTARDFVSSFEVV